MDYVQNMKLTTKQQEATMQETSPLDETLSSPLRCDPLPFQIVKITPALAKEWLAKNLPHNRPLRPNIVRLYKNDMLEGKWRESGESIKFDVNGHLIDGQHRLAAIIQANVTLSCDVRFQLPIQSFINLDCGKKRTLGNVLQIRGEKNAVALAAAIGIVWAYETRHIGSIGAVVISRETAIETLDKHPRLRLSLEPGLATQQILVPSLSIAFHYLCSTKKQEEARVFWHRLATGENLSMGTPIYLLRERLIAERGNNKRGGLSAIERAALIIKAWNAYVENKPIKSLRWQSQAANPEKFPLLIGDEE